MQARPPRGMASGWRPGASKSSSLFSSSTSVWLGPFTVNVYYISNYRENTALAGAAQGIGCWPVNQRVAGSIPSQGTCLGCGPGAH